MLPNDELVGSFTIYQLWEADELAEAQQKDPDMALLYAETRDKRVKPHGAQISPLSKAAKNYMHDWKRVAMQPNGVLYRHWKNADDTDVMARSCCRLTTTRRNVPSGARGADSWAHGMPKDAAKSAAE